MEYLRGLVKAVAGPGWAWWISLLFTYFLVGAGAYPNYPQVRDFINRAAPLMPEEFPVWMVLVPFMLWVVARLAHREAMAHSRAARIVFDEPYVQNFIPLFGTIGTTRTQIGENDMAKIAVRNVPYDSASGRVIQDAFARFAMYDQRTGAKVLEFDYPRWQENPKPGYFGNPPDHIRDDWNRRDLQPSGDKSLLNFLIKTRGHDKAYGFRASSQLKPLWHDPDLAVPPGEYWGRLTVCGVGLREPAEQWFSVRIGGAGEPMAVEKSKAPEKRWF